MATNDTLTSGVEVPQALQPVVRIQRNILAASERRLLTWLCARLPVWVTPDILTALGFFGMILVCAGYAFSTQSVAWLWLAIAGFCINWFGDSLDGSLARFRKIERPQFGYFIDHSTDALGNLIAMIGLGLSPFVRFDVALFSITAYLLFSIHTFLAARVVNEFRLSYVASGPTELRLILIAMTLMMLRFGPNLLFWHGLSPFDMFIGGVGIILIGLFLIQTFVIARQLHRSHK
jgi:archaetidylinositol phosphate synthase